MRVVSSSDNQLQIEDILRYPGSEFVIQGKYEISPYDTVQGESNCMSFFFPLPLDGVVTSDKHCEVKGRCGSVPCYGYKSKFHFLIFLAMVGVASTLLFATIVPLVFHHLEYEGIREEVVIDSKSAQNYDTWQSNYYGGGKKRLISYEIFIFNVQNPVEALAGEKPIVVQQGPYAFNQYFNKFDIKWSDDGDTVQYRLQTFYIYDPVNSGPGLDQYDNVTLAYPSALGFEYLLQQIPISSQELLDAAIESLINTKLDSIDNAIDAAIRAVERNPLLTPEEKNKTLTELYALENLVAVVRAGLTEFVEEAPAGSSLLKIILCTSLPSGNGVSLFYQTNPVNAYFGFMNDPLKSEVQRLIDYLNLTDEVPWDTSVPGATTNYTSEADARRRRDINIQKTGKKNLKEVGKYVRANNQTTQYVCVYPMDSQPPDDGYIEGVNFPFCEPFQYEWNASVAESKGYVLVWASDYANRIAGTDGNLFGAPANTEKVLLYINDIYRTAYSIYQKDTTDWHGVTLRRYGVQLKDSQNTTLNPTEAWQYYNNAPSGMQNLTIVATTPYFISKPHFLDADPSLVAAVVGLTPNRAIHDTYIDLEPNTGALCRVHNRVQVIYEMTNMNLPEVDPTTVIALDALCLGLQNISNTTNCDGLDVLTRCLGTPSNWRVYGDKLYLPYAWIDQSAEADKDDAKSIKNGLYMTDNYANQIQLWCYVSAALFTMFIIGMYSAKYVVKTEEAAEEHTTITAAAALD